MKRIIGHLREYGLKYGFVTVGILLAISCNKKENISPEFIYEDYRVVSVEKRYSGCGYSKTDTCSTILNYEYDTQNRVIKRSLDLLELKYFYDNSLLVTVESYRKNRLRERTIYIYENGQIKYKDLEILAANSVHRTYYLHEANSLIDIDTAKIDGDVFVIKTTITEHETVEKQFKNDELISVNKSTVTYSHLPNFGLMGSDSPTPILSFIPGGNNLPKEISYFSDSKGFITQYTHSYDYMINEGLITSYHITNDNDPLFNFNLIGIFLTWEKKN